MSTVYDTRRCALGEGPLWHPERGQLFWFDILGKRLLSRDGAKPLEWRFDDMVSAAGWVDRDTLLIASETGLWRFDLTSGNRMLVIPLEADNPLTRSNDGRADRQGGFWIGTMGKGAQPGMGALYRYYRGELRKLFASMTIPNALCFSPDGTLAYFSDTDAQRLFRVALDAQGWPRGAAAPFVDLAPKGRYPDGAVCDSEGGIWNAHWGAGCVERFLPDGSFDRSIAVAGLHSSCPAFGGADLATLFVTSAYDGLDNPDADQGCVFSLPAGVAGLAENRVDL
ncbi:SMP-30/gluconolactonase/LRE family protein [Pararhodobacter zhoushanensis]|uniref:SMP-30/gluconolactonase/LRE family protein n=1 Tax=Pararhodobacter zhoushanensis TaxID=2479545 RepID=UPI000F8E2B07|nr:SMP-30/gluconolactonase/LRE family protein [Pararhodobacter zhoushanensis]